MKEALYSLFLLEWGNKYAKFNKTFKRPVYVRQSPLSLPRSEAEQTWRARLSEPDRYKLRQVGSREVFR